MILRSSDRSPYRGILQECRKRKNSWLDGDIWIPYERLYAKLYRFHVNGITKYMLEKSPYHGCSVLVNDEQLANKKWLSSGDIISSGHHGTRLVFHAITSSREVLAAELIGSRQGHHGTRLVFHAITSSREVLAAELIGSRQVPSASNEVQPQSSSGGDDPLEMNPLSSGEQAQEANVRMNSLLRRALIVQVRSQIVAYVDRFCVLFSGQL
ncbi:hypothetical protein TELCIR_04337 [Teladorsagia circumcincta]|uniref:Uncharacterized protein n=1 Tax=Teladorsagia circumcincta TaxID=45464 RepID=A0A2G9UU48_TELCI|nr:hypothetical protein TELCIR_04337 [Teladorsagia circumcincta]